MARELAENLILPNKEINLGTKKPAQDNLGAGLYDRRSYP